MSCLDAVVLVLSSQAAYLGTLVAIKTALQYVGKDSSLQPQLLNELRLLRHVRHPNIVSFYGAALLQGSSFGVLLVLELVDGPMLSQYVKDVYAVQPQSKCLRWMHGVLDGTSLALRHLHEGPNITHGDLKLANIKVVLGLNSEPQAKLLDFGLARAREIGTTAIGKTRLWAAPEVRPRMSRATSASDIFSFAYVI
ncbi:unnamed protein product [Polarella glacialis]|uniref:Protein kinase domain-containing protein n=1 Tax=Polarella glacialis TaxID=89957 RepID=A0A813FJJ5_POLGL|nr:unnamed protein product [Polarella glacialis]